jgi:hypothetical protein
MRVTERESNERGYVGRLDEIVRQREAPTCLRFDCFAAHDCGRNIGNEKSTRLDWLRSVDTYAVEFQVEERASSPLFPQWLYPGRWVRLVEDKHGTEGVVTSSSRLAEPVHAKFRLDPKDGREGVHHHLSRIVAEPLRKTASKAEISEALMPVRARGPAFGLAVYDVGQGNCNAVVNDAGMPFLYFDLGTAWGFNSKTRPKTINFCFSAEPAIVLSHWDQDHWFAVRYDPRALDRKWIVPQQQLRPSHAKLAAELLAKGNLLVCPPNFGSIPLPFMPGQLIECTGSTMNDSGIALQIHFTERSHERPQRRKRFTVVAAGDAAFRYVPVGGFDSFVAPHHGAFLKPKDVPKAAGASKYAVSYGSNNTYGHPTSSMERQYRSSGWVTRLETPNGGIVLGPHLVSAPSLPCAGRCSFALVQV